MDLTTAAVFSSNMVLQQGSALPVWGTAAPGAAVDCVLHTVRACTAADETGSWRLTLPALPAGGPYVMTVHSGGQTLQYQNVWLGEVFLAGGQSNMELELQNSQDGAQALQTCRNDRLHFYAVPKVTTPEAAERAESEAAWHTAAPDTAPTLSAVAYYASKKLTEALHDIHIGVICCYWGGTFAHCWLPRAELSEFPEGTARIAEYEARIVCRTDAEFDAACEAYQREVDDWNARIAARRAAEPDVCWAVLNAECGLFPWPPPAGRTGYQRPGNLYEAMLRRVCPYALRGFWYYQGEQDEEHAADYGALLTHLVRRWRADWGDSAGRLPFLLVQLPMFDTGLTGSWPVLRAAQSAAAQQEPNMGLVVLADCGEADNIHPTDKATPGGRLGLLTLDAVFRLPVTGRAPRAVCIQRAGGALLIRFVQTGGGLSLHGAAQGFETAGRDGIFYPAEAELLQPDTLRLHSAAVPEPTAARYAWYNFGPAPLFGGTGLPAEPFCLPEFCPRQDAPCTRSLL